MERKKIPKNESGGISRREFLKDAGLVVGGAAIGSTVLLAACGGGETTVTKTATQTVPGPTTTTTAAGGTATVTTTVPGATVTTTAGAVTQTVTESVSKFVCPVCGTEFDTLAELQAHFEAAHPAEAVPGLITLTVNGDSYLLQVDPDWTLAFVLRNKLGLTATKEGCNRGECGTCTVVMDGRSVYSCLVLAVDAQGKDIQTLEGLSDGITLHPIQQSFYEHGSHQCGYCTPGIIMSTKALLDKNANPTREEIREALSGNLCICGSNKKVIEAVLDVPRRL